MSYPKIDGVHLVGSLCGISDEEEAFRTVSKHLSNRLRRIPDGEPGKRDYFARWQVDFFRERQPLALSEVFKEEGSSTYSDDQADHVVKDVEGLETHYDDYALASYEIFKKLREHGVIEKDVRFQVCLPTPLTVVAICVRSTLRHRVEGIYQDAMSKSLSRILKSIPSSDLAIQWDSMEEIAMLEGAMPLGNEKPWFEPLFEGIVERLGRLVDSVPEEVELGFHFCYGDSGHKHFMEPKDTRTVVELANAVLKKCNRHVNWIHLPVPKDRNDREYFQPLQDLNQEPQPSELVLGLVHFNDLDGTKERIRTAGEFVDSFSIATECGMGRTPPEQLESILQICANVTDSGGSTGAE